MYLVNMIKIFTIMLDFYMCLGLFLGFAFYFLKTVSFWLLGVLFIIVVLILYLSQHIKSFALLLLTLFTLNYFS